MGTLACGFQLKIRSLLLVVLQLHVGEGCTIVAAGRDASASGHPMVAHTDDGGAEPSDVRFVRVPRKTWPRGSTRPFHVWSQHYPRVVNGDRSPDYAPWQGQEETQSVGSIPQVSETFAYWDMDYGVQNEHGLSMAESTCAARTAGWPVTKTNGHCRVGIEDLSKLGLERCATARCAVQLMGDVAVEQGFYSADSGDQANPDFEDSSESLAVADSQDLWIFNVMTGPGNASAIWAAQRVDPGHVITIANTFTIRKIDLHDADNFLYSPNVTSLALDMGWWQPDDDEPGFFSWSRVYGYPFLEDGGPFNSGRRMWRIYSVLNPVAGAALDPEKGDVPTTKDPYPASFLVLKSSVTPQKIMAVLRDHYEGTPYDLTAGIAAGPFGTPNRAGGKGVIGTFERAISPQQSSWSYVAEATGGPLGGMVWLGYGAPHGTAYLPFIGAANGRAPDGFCSHKGTQSKFSHEVAWWAFAVADQFADLNFKLINADIQQKAFGVEARAFVEVEKCKAQANQSADLAGAVTDCLDAFAVNSVEEWWQYAWSLFAKFGRYSVTESETNFSSQVYPEWWLRSPDVGFASWKAGGPYHGVPCITAAASVAKTQEAADLPLHHGSAEIASLAAALSLVVSVVALIAGWIGYRAGARKGSAAAHGYIRIDA